ncbi:MAG: ABC transporter substrate-binding protein [Deltaproteobacteria bacterium]|nr:ABC transporter substrate-binding protein [Deltaproteobacteria bacterium]
MKSKVTAGIGVAILMLATIFSPSLGKAAEPIRMLALDPLSGVMKDIGDRYHLGIKLAVEEVNASGGLLGRPIKMFYDDSQLKPDVAVRKVSRYISEEKVQFIMTGTGTHVAKAMGQVAEKEKVIMLNYGAAGDELTGKDFTPYQFRVALSTGQQSGALAAYFAGTAYKKYYIVCQDYAFGHDVAEAFKKAMNRLKPGWQMMGEDYHPVGTKDMGPYISKIISSGAEVLITGNWGADLLVLLKQAGALGLKTKVGSYYLSDPLSLPAIGDSAIGNITVEIYMLTEDTPQNKAFIERWKKRNLDPATPYPAWLIGKAYQAFMFMVEAVKKAKSPNAGDVIKAWEGMSYDALVGRMTMRACDHQVMTPISVAEVLPGPGPYYKFPFVGKPNMIPADKGAVPPAETGNPRCK